MARPVESRRRVNMIKWFTDHRVNNRCPEKYIENILFRHVKC